MEVAGAVKQGRSQGQGAREGALSQCVDYPSDMSRGVGGAFAQGGVYVTAGELVPRSS